MPNGALGTWMTKRSKSVCLGRPEAWTFITSTGPSFCTTTLALACGRHPAATMPGERCMPKTFLWADASAWVEPTTAAPVANAAAPVAASVRRLILMVTPWCG